MFVNVIYPILFLCLLFQPSLCIVSSRITINIVLNGLVYQKGTSKDRCKLISAIDGIIDQAKIRYNKIRDAPDHWSIYLNGKLVPSDGCADNSGTDKLKITNGDHVYVFLNEKGLTDPLYVGEYMKFVSREFSEVLNLNRHKPSCGKKGKLSDDAANLLKILLNQEFINRVIKELSNGNGKEVLLNLIAKFMGASAQTKANKREPGKHEAENNKPDPVVVNAPATTQNIQNLLTMFTQPLLEGFMGTSKKNTEL